MSEREVDLCVIGSGPGGYVAAIRAGQLGLRTAIVERDAIGGVCLNRGCIPTKAMLRSANVFDLLKRSEELGILADNVRVDYQQVIKRRDRVVKNLTNGVGSLLQSQAVEIIHGSAQLAGPGRVRVRVRGGEPIDIQARNVVIATGSRPASLPIPGADGEGVIDSDGALALAEIPRRMLVIGGGAVGAEWANIFHSLGTEMTLVEMLPTLVPVEDEEIGKLLGRVFSRRGITVRTSAKVERIEASASGARLCTVVGADGQSEQVEVDVVLIGVGRRPVTDGLGLEEAGVKLERGWVMVDDAMRTNLPGVFAIGDVTGKKLLAHVASHQGIVATENAAGEARTMDYKAVPGCTYTHPEVASVGLTEKQAIEAGYEVQVGRFPFAASGRAMVGGETEGMVKVVAEAKYGELLGAHIIGSEASELIPESVLALRLEATLEDIATAIHAHPTLAESVMEACLAATGRSIHLPKPRERARRG
ncbi:MAG: dihydrolipoyl dehydrogenase [Chloroflexi bacterium]|nr:dihydrolipoyl dehydrogenase [Chloroflexota bacterium]